MLSVVPAPVSSAPRTESPPQESVAVPAASPPPLRVCLFGGLTVAVRETPLRKLRTRHGGRLIALLALSTGRELERTTLAGQLWPDSPPEAGAVSLRRALTDLRDALGPESARLESVSFFTLRLSLAGGATCDLNELDLAIVQGTYESLDRAIELYRGPLMPDLDAVCDPDGVFQVERERCRVAFLDAVERRAERRRSRGQSDDAIADLRRLLSADPTRESASRALMELLASSRDDRAGAVTEYLRLRQALLRDLETKPEPASTALYERIRAGRMERAVKGAAAAAPHNMPTRLTRFIGRETAVNAVRALLSKNRLLTLVGTGGVGKTRLAQQVAIGALYAFPDGVWQVEFASFSASSDSVFVARVVAAALKIKEQPELSVTETLISALHNKRLLLLLDNCEHLIQAFAEFAAALLGSCPGVSALITSREPLGIFGEQTYRVPSLTLPNRKISESTTAESLLQFEAIRLFADRVALSKPGFLVTNENGRLVVSLCQRLDGIPLALELAAARVRTLPLNEILDRLHDRFHLLTNGDPTALPRQQTLRALVDWSYDLLTESEKTLFTRLSAFAGGWTLEAAESVCAGEAASPDFEPLTGEELLDLLSSLTDKSLILIDEDKNAGTSRYTMLETLRQYAAGKAESRGETDVLSERHRDYFVTMTGGAAPKLQGPEQGKWLDVLEMEHDNLRVALDRCAQTAASNRMSALAGLRLAGSLRRFWALRGYLSEGRQQLARALAARPCVEHVEEDTSGPNVAAKKAIAEALAAAGALASFQGDYACARALYEDSLALWFEIGDKRGIADIRNIQGIAAFEQGDFESAQTLYGESLGIYREIGEKQSMAYLLNNLGGVASDQGDFLLAQTRYEESLSLHRNLGNKNNVASTLNNLGIVAESLFNYIVANAQYEESLSIHREIGDKRGIAVSLNSLGSLSAGQGDYVSARARYEESLALDYEIGNKWGCAYGLEGMAVVCSAEGDAHKAVILWAAAGALRAEIGTSLLPGDQVEQDGLIVQAQAGMGKAEFAASWADGQMLSWSQAVELAIHE